MAVGAIYLTNESSGAPALSGINGTLCSVLDWALVQKGWAIEYTATNNRIYRPGAGNRNRLFVCHDGTTGGAANFALIRGCENATAAASASLTNPFPTVTQVANTSCSVCLSNGANSTARPYRIILTDRFLVMATGTTGANNGGWDMFFFGDTYGADASDAYATAIGVGNATTTTTSSRLLGNSVFPGVYGTGSIYFCRSIDGTVLSTKGSIDCLSQSMAPNAWGYVYSLPAMRMGYQNRVEREKVPLSCTGSAAGTVGGLAIRRRGWLPNLWNPSHSGAGSVTSDDVWTDSAYVSGSSFCAVLASAGSGIAILETTDTWTSP